MRSAIRKLLAFPVIVGLCALLVWAFIEGRAELAAEREREKPIKIPPRLEKLADGTSAIMLDDTALARASVRTEPVTSTTLLSEITAYGVITEDPSRVERLKSPIAGVLAASREGAWPSVGQEVASGMEIGRVRPRFTPTDRIDQAARFATAEAEASSARVAVTSARAALARAVALNADDHNVSDRAVEEARTRLATEQGRQATADRTVEILRGLVAGRSKVDDIAVAAPVTGQVIEVLALPAEPVESGQLLARIARYDQLLVDVDLPVSEGIAAPPGQARIVPAGHPDRSLRAVRVATVAHPDAAAPGRRYLFRLDANPLDLRPGHRVVAHLSTGEKRAGVLVPSSALVWVGGRTCVFRELAKGRFTRTPVYVDRELGNVAFVSAGLAPGACVVATGAQALLSEEMKAQIHVLEDGE